MNMATIDHLVLSALEIQPGQSREFDLSWDITHDGARRIGLKLAQRRNGATFKVTKLGDRRICVEATEPVQGFTMSGRPNADLRGDEALLRRKRR